MTQTYLEAASDRINNMDSRIPLAVNMGLLQAAVECLLRHLEQTAGSVGATEPVDHGTQTWWERAETASQETAPATCERHAWGLTEKLERTTDNLAFCWNSGCGAIKLGPTVYLPQREG